MEGKNMPFTRRQPAEPADKYAISISGDSAEAIAYALLERIAEAEHWVAALNVPGGPRQRWNKTREEILDTFSECYRAARGHEWRQS
jgi:hypothetical protein